MKKIKTTTLIIVCGLVMQMNIVCKAQSPEETSKQIDDLNRTIDRAVVKLDLTTLEKHYEEDFVFIYARHRPRGFKAHLA